MQTNLWYYQLEFLFPSSKSSGLRTCAGKEIRTFLRHHSLRLLFHANLGVTTFPVDIILQPLHIPPTITFMEEKAVTRLFQIVQKSVCYQELRQPHNSCRAQGQQVSGQIVLFSTRLEIIFYSKSFLGLDCYEDSQKEDMPQPDPG